MNRKVAALLLAAGRSSRMGRCKQLLPLGGTSVIGRCLESLRHGGVNTIVVIVSKEGAEVAKATEEHSVRVVVNPDSDSDMASSICVGRDVLEADFSGVIVALCDYPLVTSATIASLAVQHAIFPDFILIPKHLDYRGHPLLFPRVVLEELEEGMTLRDVMRKDPQRVREVPVEDPGILLDMDTPDDYIRICNLLDQ